MTFVDLSSCLLPSPTSFADSPPMHFTAPTGFACAFLSLGPFAPGLKAGAILLMFSAIPGVVAQKMRVGAGSFEARARLG